MRAGAGPPLQPTFRKNVSLKGTVPWGTPTIPIVDPGRAIAAAVSIACCVPTHSSAASAPTPSVRSNTVWFASSPRVSTDVVETRGEEANQTVLDLTDGVGADAALECVGTQQAIETAAAIARPGSTIGIVGVPHGTVPFNETFFRNVGWSGGPAPARIYIPELLDDVLGGTINP